MSNQITAPNCRQAFQFRSAGFSGRCIRWQRPFPAAVGELGRWHHRTLMWQSYIFGMHWKHGGKMYYDELTAESQDEAAGYFIDHCRDDVSLVRVELVGPDDGGTRELAHSPDSPFDPLMARRRLDREEDQR